MIKTENHLAEKCQGCPCFEATMHRDDIYTDNTVAVIGLGVSITYYISVSDLPDWFKFYLLSR